MQKVTIRISSIGQHIEKREIICDSGTSERHDCAPWVNIW